MSKLWSIPVISVYLYGITILTQYGYNSYFNIPSSLVESSITQNFVYFFQLFELGSAVAGVMKWWFWVVFAVGILTILFFYFSHRWWQKIITFGFVIVLIYFLHGSYGFGQLLAKSTEDFYIPSQPCDGLKEGRYVILNFYQGQAILVPVDAENKMTGDYLVKNLAELNCTMKMDHVGKITK